jgi:hypothetical protein
MWQNHAWQPGHAEDARLMRGKRDECAADQQDRRDA